jgi:NAD/NADP transhydrogenase alpha subunit
MLSSFDLVTASLVQTTSTGLPQVIYVVPVAFGAVVMTFVALEHALQAEAKTVLVSLAGVVLVALIGVLVLSGTVVDITRNYFDRRVKGKDIEPMWSAFLEYQKQEEAEAAAEEAELEKAANE